MFGTYNLAQLVQSQCHSSDSHDNSDMYDIHDSPAWRNAYARDGIFLGDPRGISFALCADSVNPFLIDRTTYSMTPIIMTILNYPWEIRNLFSRMLLVGIVPGPCDPHSLNPYLEVVVYELLSLTSMQVFDSFSMASFNLKVEVLLHVLDYPGISKLFHTMGSGAYQGCMRCDVQGK